MLIVQLTVSVFSLSDSKVPDTGKTGLTAQPLLTSAVFIVTQLFKALD